jgi:hypothetical protein
MDRFVLAEALPAFFAHFATEDVTPAIDGERHPLLSDEFRYLPVRSEIM